MNAQEQNVIDIDANKPDPAVAEFLHEIEMHESMRELALRDGMPALHRLATIAQGDTGQCIAVRNLLLGLYNGHDFPFDLTQLRGLDRGIFDDCMAVILLDARATYQEVHKYIDNGRSIFKKWAIDRKHNSEKDS